MSTLNATDLEHFSLDLSDREIYNDIRTECDITAILTIRPDATPEFFDTFKASAWAEPISACTFPEGLPPIPTTLNIVATADPDHSEIVWGDIVDYSFSPVTLFGWGQGACEELGGEYRDGSPPMCLLPQSLIKSDIDWKIIQRGTTTCTIRVTNNSIYDVRGVWTVSYLAVSPETRYIKLRSTNETSIAKYGRRVMDKPWPLGIHPVMMQSLIDSDCERYSEPVSVASMTIVGSNDTWLAYILTFGIDDKHTIVHPGLNLNKEFFINNTDYSCQREGDGLLRGAFDLEEVRDMEQLTIFTLDVSELDGDHVLG